MSDTWFQVEQINPHLWIIRERLDSIDPRYFTTYTNLYLIVGEHSAILLDTGSGFGDLHSIIDPIVDDRLLYVINTHNHFDHIGGNYQFETTHIHRLDFKKLMFPMDLTFLQGCEPDFEHHFAERNWVMTFAEENIPLIGNEVYDLGGLKAELIHTPGHTPGSICLKVNNEIFTGDTLHYGAVFLPGSDHMPFYRQSLEFLGKTISRQDLIYPGHEDFGVTKSLFRQFLNVLNNLDKHEFSYSNHLSAKIYDLGKFTIIQPDEIKT